MKLDRNMPGNLGRGKYALLLMREIDPDDDDVDRALRLLEGRGLIDYGEHGTESEFFVIRLKDRYAHDALFAYARAAQQHDREWSQEVREMANRAGLFSDWCKDPD